MTSKVVYAVPGKAGAKNIPIAIGELDVALISILVGSSSQIASGVPIFAATCLRSRHRCSYHSLAIVFNYYYYAL